MLIINSPSHKTPLVSIQSLNSLADLAQYLGFTPMRLGYILYALEGGPDGQYTDFSIKKRNGDERVISAPRTGLKYIQKRLSRKLQGIYYAKKSVHGFVADRNIITNAMKHSRKRFVFKVDLHDFFPTIHFGRVLGLFSSRPYSINRNVSILMAKIACYKNCLPQGSPCSPVISNMICALLDRQLSDLARKTGCYYTRYADDLTFSSNKKFFPEDVAVADGAVWYPGQELERIITENTFQVNHEKTTMRTRSDRQVVTGIVVNDYPNIRRKSLKQVRAMLHDWKVCGLEGAAKRYNENFNLMNSKSKLVDSSRFKKILHGKLEHIRFVRNSRVDHLNGVDENESRRNRVQHKRRDYQSKIFDQCYKYLVRYEQLCHRDSEFPVVLGEGETDWMHFRMALQALKAHGKHTKLRLNIYKHKAYMEGGWGCLQKFCKNALSHYVQFSKPVICVFDCDVSPIMALHRGRDFYFWGNNIYSMVIPRPSHRQIESFSIEQLYHNKDLLQTDQKGRRIYLSTEFHSNGKLIEDSRVAYGVKASNGKEIKGWKSHVKDRQDEKVIDNAVCETIVKGKRISRALSKVSFARNVYFRTPPYQNMDYSGFIPTFERIERILDYCIGLQDEKA